MTSRLEPSEDKALKAKSVFALLLVICSTPVLASSGINVDCVVSSANSLDRAAPAATVALELVDHGIATSDIDLSAIGKSAADTSPGASILSLTPRAATIAQQIFNDDPSSILPSSMNSAADPVPTNATDISPLTSTEVTPEMDEQKNTSRTESVTINNANAPGPVSQLPGVSDADHLRFRRQMYRTDI